MTLGRRLLDVAGAAAGLIVLLPVLLVIAASVSLDGGPVFFRQERIGRKARPFRMWKFRTMIVDAERQGLPLTIGRDPRVTRVGAWLRRHKLDELPQLLNVLRGDMTLVGPRPEVRRYVARYTPEQRRVLDLVPGITDPASLRFHDESLLLAEATDPEAMYVDQLMPEKIRMNLAYAASATVWTDLRVVTTTLVGMLPPAAAALLGRALPVSHSWDDSRVGFER